MGLAMTGLSFRDLQNYTTLKRCGNLLRLPYCFRDLQNYTTLKQFKQLIQHTRSFRDLQNYTTLKPCLGVE